MVVCWSVKGGSGTTVVASSLALLLARRGPALLVDLAGDVAPALGLPPGSDDGPVPVTGALDLADLTAAGSGGGRPPAHVVDRVEALAAGRRVVVDAGRVEGPDTAASEAVARASCSVLVVRACFLALVRAHRCGRRPDLVVVVREPGRSLDVDDVQAVLGARVVGVPWHASIARAVDAGRLAASVPRVLERSLDGVLACV